MEDAVQEAVQAQLVKGQLPCAHAMAIAQDLGVSPGDVGSVANQAGIRISFCQLGLFGYGPKAEGKHKIVQPLSVVPQAVAEHLHAAAAADGISCFTLWQIADQLSLSRLEAAGAVETLGMHVSHCQLGCFPRPKAGR